jgi:acyl-CoA synthetase (NDP forming)
LLLHECLDIVSAAGIATPDHQVFGQPSVPGEQSLGFPGPYAVKLIAEGVSHKSDVGAVALGLSDGPAVRAASSEMIQKFLSTDGSGVRGVLVQAMAPRRPGSYELIVGGKRDPQFGPVVVLGHGGIFVEILEKTSLRMAPLSPAEVHEMIDELPGSEILRGVRGRPAVDRVALRDAILAVAQLMVECEEIDSIDVNPILVSDAGAVAVDARIFLRGSEA